MASAVPPAGNGTMIRTVRFGNSCACEAGSAVINAATPTAAESSKRPVRCPKVIRSFKCMVRLPQSVHQSMAIFAASTTGPHCWVLALIILRISSGELPSGSASSARMRLRSSSVLNPCPIASESRCVMSLGVVLDALATAGRKQLQLAGVDVLLIGEQIVGNEIDIAAEQIVHRRRTAAVGNLRHAEFAPQHHQLAEQMAGIALALVSIVDL